MTPGEPIDDFFVRWKQATLDTIAFRTWGHRQWFAASALRLAEMGITVNVQKRCLNRGYLLVKI